MRPQQQNRRMRGRGNNNNNRKGPNPLTRSYESNGPDVKIRGTAQQVAEKYAALARDAQSSGDRVMAENYLQHAEHYNRIIAAALAQQQQQFQQRDVQDDFDGDDEDRPEREMQPAQQPQAQPQYHVNGYGPQPVIDDTPAPAAFEAVAGEQQVPAAPANGGDNGPQRAEGEESGQPRRGRRPRRPVRARPDQAEGNGEAASETEAPQAPEAAE